MKKLVLTLELCLWIRVLHIHQFKDDFIFAYLCIYNEIHPYIHQMCLGLTMLNAEYWTYLLWYCSGTVWKHISGDIYIPSCDIKLPLLWKKTKWQSLTGLLSHFSTWFGYPYLMTWLSISIMIACTVPLLWFPKSNHTKSHWCPNGV